MTRLIARHALMALAVGSLLSPPASDARAADRPAAAILAEINEVKPPELSPEKRSDPAARLAYLTEVRKVQMRKAELIGELAKAAPTAPELVKLLPERWLTLLRSDPGKADAVVKEIDEAAATSKNDAVKVEGGFFKAQIAMMKARTNMEAALPAVEEFAKAAPKDERAAMLLNVIAGSTRDEAVKTRIEDKILKDFPDSSAVKSIEAARRLRTAVGKPFDLEFTEAITESSVSMKGLKGKVVVIDFWATWCGPCVAEMPTMKKLYAEYKPKGVEFIGISLDQPKEAGGLDALKAFVAKNEITWPQYYQGKGWESEFSVSWGIDSIPRVFIVDADGKLASVDAGGKLDTMIPELLKKAHPAAGAGGE